MAKSSRTEKDKNHASGGAGGAYAKKEKKRKNAEPAVPTAATPLTPQQDAPHLSERLLGIAKELGADKELDAIFMHSAGASIPPNSFAMVPDSTRKSGLFTCQTLESAAPRISKRKVEQNSVDSNDQYSEARAKRIKPHTTTSHKKRVTFAVDGALSTGESHTTSGPLVMEGHKKKTRSRLNSRDHPLGGEACLDGASKSRVSQPTDASLLSDDGAIEDDDIDSAKLVHESVEASSKSKGVRKAKYAPEGETREERDARTVFVGNLPPNVIKSNSAIKSLYRHLLSSIPSSARVKIESHRFRSVAFTAATSEPTIKDASTNEAKPVAGHQSHTTVSETSKKQVRQQERASSWRESEKVEEPPSKVYLSSKEKKRISFIKGQLNENAQSVNCYVVFAHEPPAAKSDEVPSPMHPRDVAKAVAKTADGSIFMDRTIHVDVAVKQGSDKTPAEKTDDMKATIFIGNLDFAAKEEDLRALFESLVTQERGAPDGATDKGSSAGDDTGEESGAERPKTWVKHVRIVRDKDTQIGKGFAYVQFLDRECVDEILALGEGAVKFAKRKLRIQRNKTLPGSTVAVKKPKPVSKSQTKRPEKQQNAVNYGRSIPRGDPELGDRLKSLSKEDRKAVKSSDASRVARRLAKKNLKAASGKSTSTKARKAILGNTLGKDLSKPRLRLNRRAGSDKHVKK